MRLILIPMGVVGAGITCYIGDSQTTTSIAVYRTEQSKKQGEHKQKV